MEAITILTRGVRQRTGRAAGRCRHEPGGVGHDPWAYLNDEPTRLPMHLNSRIDELLPHC